METALASLGLGAVIAVVTPTLELALRDLLSDTLDTHVRGL